MMMTKTSRVIVNGLKFASTRQVCSVPSIGINGFGRIGKCLLRLAFKNRNVNVAAINQPNADVNTIAHSFKQDSVHGPFFGKVVVHDNCLHINDKIIRVFHEQNPENIKWCRVSANYVIDSTGKFTEVKAAERHLAGGAKKVIISAPSKDAPMFVKGVNFDSYKKTMTVVSNASCTTNCAAPLIHMMHKKFGVENCLLTTVHAMTATQPVLDGLNNRSASGNIIPSATGAAKAVGLVIPELQGKIDGDSIRVPVLDVSLLKLYMNVKSDVDVEAIKCAVWKSSECCHKSLISFYDKSEKFVSSDFVGSEYSGVVDFNQIEVIGRFVSIGAWYDNEMGYSSRLIDLVRHMTKVDSEK